MKPLHFSLALLVLLTAIVSSERAHALDDFDINGVVLDASGVPVTGAQVRCYRLDTRAEKFWPLVSHAITDTDGYFVLDLHEQGTYNIHVRSDTHPDLLVSNAAAGGRDLEWRLPAGASLHLTIQDPQGESVADCTVTVGRKAQIGPAVFQSLDRQQARTNMAGRAQFNGLSPGSYSIQVETEEFGNHNTQMPITAGASHRETVKLTRRGRVSGRVLDRDGAPIAGARLDYSYITENGAGGALWSAATTNINGRYDIRGIETRPFRLRVVHQDQTIAIKDGVLTPAQSVLEGFDIQAGEGQFLAGYVQSGEGRGIADANVTLIILPKEEGVGAGTWYDAKTITDASGAFIFLIGAAGRYGFLVEHPDYAEGRFQEEPWRLSENESRSDIVLTLEEGVPIAGWIEDASGNPVAGATISHTAYKQPGKTGYGYRKKGSVTSSEDGFFALHHLLSDTEYDLLVEAEGYPDREIENVDSGKNDLIVTLGAALVVGGRVVTVDGAPLAGTKVEISSRGINSTPFVFTSDQDGRFQVSGLAAGQYHVFARLDGYTMRSPVSFTLSSNTTTPPDPLVITLLQGQSIRGRLVDAQSGEGLPRAMVQVYQGDGTPEIKFHSMSTTGSDGTFQTDPLPSGRFRLMPVAEGYVPGGGMTAGFSGVPVTVPRSDDDGEIRIEMTRGAIIKGTITRGDGSPASGVSVNAGFLYQGHRVNGRPTQTDTLGHYEVAGLPVPVTTRILVEYGFHLVAQTDDMVIRDGNPLTVNIAIPQPGTLSGRVLTRGGDPVENASIQARVEVPQGTPRVVASTRADADGNFTLDNVHGETVILHVQHPGFVILDKEDIQVHPGVENSGILLILTPGLKVGGKVVHAEGRPLSNVGLLALESETDKLLGTGSSDSEGRFLIDSLPVGRFSLRATQRDTRETAVVDDLTPGKMDVTIRITGN